MTWFTKWRWFGLRGVSRRATTRSGRRRKPAPALEVLEDRTTPTTFTILNGDVAGLKSAIATANTDGQVDTIVLAPNGTYKLTAVDNTTDGPNGLPVLTFTNLLIQGNGATIERSVTASGPAFRLLDVGAGAKATLKNLVLTGGLIQGAAGSNGQDGNHGGAGTVAPDAGGTGANGLNGADGGDAMGGGIYLSGGTLTLNGVYLHENDATAGNGGFGGDGGDGGDGGGAAQLHPTGNLPLSYGGKGTEGGGGGKGGNGGDGGKGGSAFGAGIYVQSGTLTLIASTLSFNSAKGGNGGGGGEGGYGADGGRGGDVSQAGADGGAPQTGVSGANGQPGKAGGNGGDGGDGGNGGNAGAGGDAQGGGIYMDHGTLVVENSTVTYNEARASPFAGAGGDGGSGGRGAPGGNGAAGGQGGAGGNGARTAHGHTVGPGKKGGSGGAGGKGGDAGAGGGGGDGGKPADGGSAQGGGLYVANGSVLLLSTSVTGNEALSNLKGGKGGRGGRGGTGNAGGDGAAGGHGGGGGSGTYGGSGGPGGAGGAAGDAGDGGDGGQPEGGANGGDAAGGGAFFLSSGVTILNSTFESNTAQGGFGGAGGAAGHGGSGGPIGTSRNSRGPGTGGPGGSGGFGGHGAHLGGAGGDGGDGGEGAKGGLGGNAQNGATGGNSAQGQGGGIYQSGGSLTLLASTIDKNAAIGGHGGAGGAGGGAVTIERFTGSGGSGRRGGAGGFAGRGGSGQTGGDGGRGGNGGNGGIGGTAGVHANGGAGGNGGDAQGGGIYLATGGLVAVVSSPATVVDNSVTAGQGGAGGTLGMHINPVGQPKPGGAGGVAGNGAHGGAGTADNGTDGLNGSPGKNGASTTVATESPGSKGASGMSDSPNISGGTTADTTPPTATVAAVDVTSDNADAVNPYTFTIAYSDNAFVTAASVARTVIQVTPPSGRPITARAIHTQTSALADAQGNAQTITVTYQSTPPGRHWDKAPNGTYAIKLIAGPPKDLAGNVLPLGQVGVFHVDVIALAPDSLPDAEVGSAYSQNLVATGGIGPLTVTYDVTSGTIPTGLNFGADGNPLAITGTPTAEGTVAFDATATDGRESVTQSYTLIAILPADHLIVQAPVQAVAHGKFVVTVLAENTKDQVDPVYGGRIALKLTGPSARTLTAPVVLGVATFPLSLGAIGAYSLTASSGDLTAGTGTISVIPPPRFTVTITPASGTTITAGDPATVTITATEPSGQPAYQGTIRLTSSDPRLTPPHDFTFTPASNSATFTGVVFATAGKQTFTVVDTSLASDKATGTISVVPAPLDHFNVTGFPTSDVSGVSHRVTIVAMDPYDNVITTFLAGTVQLTSVNTGNNPNFVPLNQQVSFTAADKGVVHVQVTLVSLGLQALQAADGSIGTEPNITVVSPATHLKVTVTPTSVAAGNAVTVTVTALGPNGTDKLFPDLLQLSTTDGGATITPGPLSNGIQTFQVNFATTGKQTITVTDTTRPPIKGPSVKVTVT
jgi:hypothetical protein